MLQRATAPLLTVLPLFLGAAPTSSSPPSPVAPVPPARPTATPVTAPKPIGTFSLRNVVEPIDEHDVPYLEIYSSQVTFRLSQPSNWQTVNDPEGSASFVLRGYPKATVSFRVLPKSGFIPNVELAAMDSYAAGLLVTYPENKGHQVTFHNLGDYGWTKEAGSVFQTNKGAPKGYSLRLVQRPFGTACGRLDYTVTTAKPDGAPLSIRTLDILSDLGDSILVSSYSNTADVFAGTNLPAFQSTVLKGIAVKGFPPPPPRTAPKDNQTSGKPGVKANDKKANDLPASL